MKKPVPPVGKNPCTRENLDDGYSADCRDLGPWDAELAALGRGGARPCAVTVTKNDQPFYEARYSFDASGRTLEENVEGIPEVGTYRRAWTYESDGRILTTTSTRFVDRSERDT
ncbi:hypothetical protein BH11MYX2_BH11MYX2_40270 [soil metagenome]